MQRRDFIFLIASSYAIHSNASEKEFPKKNVKLVVGSTPGALTDVATRLYAEKLGIKTGKSFVVENLAGASSTIAINSFLKSPADGHTLLAVANTVFTYPYLSRNANYSPRKDFVPVAELARGPGMLVVNKNSKYKNLKDIIQQSKKDPGSVIYASGGLGTTSHLPMEMLQKEAGIELLHVPYKGVSPAVIDVIGGRVDCMMGTPASMLSALESGQLHPIAITSEERSPEFPNVSTFKELGFPKVTYIIFISLVARSGISESLRKDIADAFNSVKNDKSLIANLRKLGQEVDPRMNDIHQLDKFLFEDEAKYAQLILENKIKID